MVVSRRPAPADQDLLARVEEQIGALHGLVAKPAGIGAEVEHQGPHAFARQALDLLLQLLGAFSRTIVMLR